MSRQLETPLFCGVENLISNKLFSEASDALEKPNGQSLTASELAYFCLLKSEVFIYLGKYDIGDLLVSALEHYRCSTDNEKFARAKFLEGWYLESKGELFEARESLMESYLNFKRSGDTTGAARALNRLAYISQLSGDIDSAVNYLGQCSAIYESLNDPKNKISISNNLAAVYFRAGLIRQSIKQYRACQESISAFSVDVKCHYLLNYSLAMASVGKVESAIEMANEANSLTGVYRREIALCFEYLGAIYILDGAFTSALSKLRKGMELASEIAPDSDLISQTKRLLADAYLGLKKYDLAQKFAEEALVVAEKINERAEIAACYRVFARVAMHNIENDIARDWFKKAIDLFAMIKSRYELAVTRYLYATSGLVGNNERIALLYMAKEYFESEEIKPFIDKIDSELATSGKSETVTRPKENGAPVFIAVSPKTRKILEKAEHFAPTDYTVLITGPTGVGKDQLAKYIHWASGRKGQYLSFNCAAFPDTMIESELFGYSKGAYTGADINKPGLIGLAENGTLCLNEIAETPIQFQVKLLDFLESKMIRPIGSTQFKKVNVRIVAATNQDLQACMTEGRFRSDLYYRLNQIEISLPPLSERLEDIPELVRYFLKERGFEFSHNGQGDTIENLCSVLSSRDWPGNIRELENFIKFQSALTGNDLSRLAELIKAPSLSEREILENTLIDTNWNQRESARRPNMTEGGVRYLIKKHGLSKRHTA